jgi:hypothetical protein
VTGVDSSGGRDWVRQTVIGGVVAGLGGALVLVCVRLIVGLELFWVISRVVGSPRAHSARVARSGIWTALKIPAYPFVGERAVEPGFDASIVLLGVVSHLGVSIIWGVLFGIVARGLSGKTTIALGVLWGVLMGWVTYYVILPLTAGATLREVPRLAAVLLLYVPYGLAIATSFLLWQRNARRRRGRGPRSPPPEGRLTPASAGSA